MDEYRSIDEIFHDIHTFIIDYIKFFNVIHEHMNKTKGNIINIKLGEEDFYLPATFNEFSQRADELQHRLQSSIRILAQKRRYDISKGIDTDYKNNQNKSSQFNDIVKINLDELQKQISDQNLSRIQMIIDSLELYDDIQTNKSCFNITFRLLPILKHIQKQLCCISKNIQKILDNNRTIIEEHLRKLQENFKSYDQDMRTKLSEYISRDIRPPVLVIPCPRHSYSPEIFTRMKSFNINHNQITNVSSEDSLSINED